MPSTLANGSVEAIIRDILGRSSSPLYIIDPTPDIVELIVTVATGMDDPPDIRLFAQEDTLKTVMGDFLVASNAADLVAQGTLDIRSTVEEPGNAILVTEDALTALIAAGQELAAIEGEDPDFAAAAFDFYAARWEDALEYQLRTPPLSRVRETLREDIGAKAEDDFETVLASLQTARGDGIGLDEVTISLLVAAKNEALLYDISKWGEDVGIASKATFSRTKTRLEELGLLDTEKVPIDVGRPRLRLKLAHERLREATGEELASVAQSLLA